MAANGLDTPVQTLAHPNDKWIRIVGIPLAVLPFVLFYLEEYGYDWRLFAMTFGWGLITTTAAWYLLFWWVMHVRMRYTLKSQTKNRILMTFGGYSLLTVITQIGETWGLSQLDFMDLMTPPEFPRVYVIHVCMALTFVIIVGGYYEITYYLQLYRVAVAEAEAVQKANLQSQFDSLKNQVNPHFLFNSLNSLSALIWEDKEKAGEFLDELATVYRYLLQTNQNRLVPLSTEINFIKSFFFLLKTRYGAALNWELITDEEGAERWLPPLTLQTLVENAIRHNVISVGVPLCITIRADSNHLTVTNSIQRKTRHIQSLSGGLNHLTALYDSLGLSLPQITDDGHLFEVKLKLLRNTENLVALP
ncbi:sensor histidine kinase [Spirosoma soli]|uniref:Sensor histidine kinase n=1 Tax=Spirosoma soli TaxID=1770529 RepID=A0ABW5LY57_9BACT